MMVRMVIASARLVGTAVAIVLLSIIAAPATGQTVPQDLAATADLLRRQLAAEPDNGDVARRLAQTLYWLKDVEGATRVYETAMARHPGDYTLRVQYARMLVETRARDRARGVLTPLLSIPEARADAEALLGLLAYWDGDLRDAKRRFGTAVGLDPGQAEAAGHLRDIRTVTAPWIRASTGFWHDNQPLDRMRFGVEAGWFATAGTTLTASLQPARYRTDDRTTAADAAELALTHVAAAGRLEATAAAGAVRRSYGVDAWEATGRASLGLRLPPHMTLRAQFDRAPYFHTTASLETPVTVDTASGALHWGRDPRGWLGELSVLYQRYPDSNAVRTGYGWLLVPLVRRDDLSLQAGYGFSVSNADESRFMPDGRYVPYYTPAHLERHSLLAAATVGHGRPASLRLDASYGVRTTDDAPTFVSEGGTLVPTFYPRTSSPFTFRAAASLRLRDGVTLEPKAEAGRTVFFSWAAVSLHLTYRFGTGATNPAGRRD